MLLRAVGPHNDFYERSIEITSRFRPENFQELAVDPEPIRRRQLRSVMKILIDTRGPHPLV